jgi:hypothetical protein
MKTRVSLASLVMFSFIPRCEFRQLKVFVYPGGSRRPMPSAIWSSMAATACRSKKPLHSSFSCLSAGPKLQARRLGTVAVL